MRVLIHKRDDPNIVGVISSEFTELVASLRLSDTNPEKALELASSLINYDLKYADDQAIWFSGKDVDKAQYKVILELTKEEKLERFFAKLEYDILAIAHGNPMEEVHAILDKIRTKLGEK